MGAVHVHAGIEEAGSAAIQRWIAHEAGRLAESHGITPLVFTGGEADRLTVPYSSGSVSSRGMLAELPSRRQERIRRIVAELAGWASETAVLVSDETLSHALWTGDEAVLTAFDELAVTHSVRVAYYIAPQNAVLERAWRRHGLTAAGHPSQFVASRSQALHFFATWERCQVLAPRVEWVVRPLWDDLLAARDVVADFAAAFLELDLSPAEIPDQNADAGLPLRVVNLLRGSSVAWSADEDASSWIGQLKRLSAGIDWEADPATLAWREVLRGYAEQVFEPGNARLAGELGWEVDRLVPPKTVAAPDVLPDPRLLDILWREQAASPERHLLVGLLHAQQDEGKSRISAAERERDVYRNQLERLSGRRAVRAAVKVADSAAPLFRLIRGRLSSPGA